MNAKLVFTGKLFTNGGGAHWKIGVQGVENQHLRSAMNTLLWFTRFDIYICGRAHMKIKAKLVFTG